jgi:hypothetical protein
MSVVMPADQTSMQARLAQNMRANWPGIVGPLLALVAFILGYTIVGYVIFILAVIVYFIRRK